MMAASCRTATHTTNHLKYHLGQQTQDRVAGCSVRSEQTAKVRGKFVHSATFSLYRPLVRLSLSRPAANFEERFG